MRKFGIWSRIRIWMHLNKINYCDGEARYHDYEKNKYLYLFVNREICANRIFTPYVILLPLLLSKNRR